MEHQSTQVNFSKAKRMEKENLSGKMEVFMKEISLMGPFKGLANITSQILINGMKENSE
jgi:hypothetical protein